MMRTGCNRFRFRRKLAFTLMELLVVIGIIGILSGLVLSALAQGPSTEPIGRLVSTTSTSLGIAFHLYWGDSNDQFPAPGSKVVYGPQPRTGFGGSMGGASRIAPSVATVGKFNPALFICPLDAGRSRSNRRAACGRALPLQLRADQLQPERQEEEPQSGDVNDHHQARKVYPFRITQVNTPSQKIMLVEECDKTINGPRWVPDGGKLPHRPA